MSAEAEEAKEDTPKDATEEDPKDTPKDAPKDAPKDKEGDEDEEELSMKGVTDPREADVLCGRGGAALRHPGNQTYRRLVNLNKQLYITCLKTEKLKISRSIVAAIREQDGRFLERDTKKETWYDIGDKKAIEKTSQALREGQPKLRQKMIASGQIPPEAGISLEHQFSNGIYSPQGSFVSSSGGSFVSSQGGDFSDPTTMPMRMHSGQPQRQTNSMSEMPPPPARMLSSDVNVNTSMAPDALMQRLSLSGLAQAQAIPSWTPSMSSASMAGPPGSLRSMGAMPSWTPSMSSSYMTTMSTMSEARSFKSRLRPSLTTRGSGVACELGMPDTNLSILSDYSAYDSIVGGGGGGGGAFNDDGYCMQFEVRPDELNNIQYPGNANGNSNAPPPPPPPPAMSPMMDSPSLRSAFDRRRVFAKMKHPNRPASGRMGMGDSQHSTGADGMPDICMVDSNYSLLSNMSGHGNKGALASYSNHGMMRESEHSVGLGSRRSLMSGLSKISDSSDNVHSVFSDLSKKFGSNVSTRSMAMSEVSGVEEVEDFHGDFQDTFNFDSIK